MMLKRRHTRQVYAQFYLTASSFCWNFSFLIFHSIFENTLCKLLRHVGLKDHGWQIHSQEAAARVEFSNGIIIIIWVLGSNIFKSQVVLVMMLNNFVAEFDYWLVFQNFPHPRIQGTDQLITIQQNVWQNRSQLLSVFYLNLVLDFNSGQLEVISNQASLGIGMSLSLGPKQAQNFKWAQKTNNHLAWWIITSVLILPKHVCTYATTCRLPCRSTKN